MSCDIDNRWDGRSAGHWKPVYPDTSKRTLNYWRSESNVGIWKPVRPLHNCPAALDSNRSGWSSCIGRLHELLSSPLLRSSWWMVRHDWLDWRMSPCYYYHYCHSPSGYCGHVNPDGCWNGDGTVPRYTRPARTTSTKLQRKKKETEKKKKIKNMTSMANQFTRGGRIRCQTGVIDKSRKGKPPSPKF